jgi:hypothetical protein
VERNRFIKAILEENKGDFSVFFRETRRPRIAKCFCGT